MKQLPHWVLTDSFTAFYDSESLTAVQQTARVYAAVQELIDEYNKFVDEINTHINEYEHNKDAQMDCFIEKITQIMNSYIESIDMKADSQNLKIAQAIEEMRLAYQTFEASMNDKQQGFEDEITERQTTFETDLTNKFETLVADIESLMTAFSKALVHAIENEGNSFIVGTDSQGVSYDYADTVPSYGVDVTGQTLVNLWGNKASDFSGLGTDAIFENGVITAIANGSTHIQPFTLKTELFKAGTEYTIISNVIENTLDTVFYVNLQNNNVSIFNDTISYSPGQTGLLISKITSINDFSGSSVSLRTQVQNTSTLDTYIKYQCIILEGDHTDKDISYFEGLKSVGETNGNNIEVKSTGKNLFDMNNYNTQKVIDTTEFFDNGFKITKTENNRYGVEYYTYLPKGDYYFSGNVESQSTLNGNGFVVTYANGSTATIGFYAISENTKVTFYDTVVQLLPYMDSGEEVGSYYKITNLMISKVENGANPVYEPYQGSTATVTLSEPLRSLPNGVKDSAEWKNDKVIVTRNVGQVVLDGSEDWAKNNTDYGVVIYFYKPLQGGITNNNDKQGAIICSHFKEIYESNSTEHIRIHASSSQLMLFISKDKLTSEDVSGLKTWLQSNTVTVAYQLATPTTEEYDVAAPELYHHVFIETGAIPTQETTHRVILNMSDQITSNTQTIASLEQRVAQLETLAVTTLPLESEGDL